MPFFSIILPTYNRASFLQRSISSVLNQTFTDFELIIIDDASTDNTEDVIETFNDTRIRYFKNQENRERSASRNKGIELSKGEYICFLDSDDSFKSNHLSVLFNYIETHNKPLALMYTGIQMNFANGEKEYVCKMPNERHNTIEWVLQKQFPPPSSSCIAKQILLIHCFNPSYKINEDIELWVRILVSYPLSFIDKITVDFYIHGGNTKFVNNNPSIEMLKVFKVICKNPDCKNRISNSFKQKQLKLLRSQIVTSVIISKNKDKIVPIILIYLLRYPFAYQNKYRLYLLLSSIPVFRIIVKSFSTLKSKISKS